MTQIQVQRTNYRYKTSIADETEKVEDLDICTANKGKKPRYRHKPGRSIANTAEEANKSIANIMEKIKNLDIGKINKPQA